jgi:hypothetical protein
MEISNIANIIKEKTPDFISVPIVAMANNIEAFRQTLGPTFSNKLLFYAVFAVIIFLILRFIWLHVF